MNDDELAAMMREPFAGVHMTRPLDNVVHRGRVLRRRRRSRGLTGAVALAGVAAVAVTIGIPGGRPPAARLAAWTVTRDSGGGITVTIRQLEDPAGLQATLQADGVPARVTFDALKQMTQPLPAGCTAPKMSDAANAHLQNKILTPPALVAWQARLPKAKKGFPIEMMQIPVGKTGLRTEVKTPQGWKVYPMPVSLQRQVRAQESDSQQAIYLNPAAIPPGIGLSIGVDYQSPSNFGYGIDLVVTSPQCTGS